MCVCFCTWGSNSWPHLQGRHLLLLCSWMSGFAVNLQHKPLDRTKGHIHVEMYIVCAAWLHRGATLGLLRQNQLKIQVTGWKSGIYTLMPKLVWNKRFADQTKHRRRPLQWGSPQCCHRQGPSPILPSANRTLILQPGNRYHLYIQEWVTRSLLFLQWTDSCFLFCFP